MALTLTLFGSFQAHHANQPLTFATNAARALLAYLAVEADRPHSRELLAALLWPDVPQAAAFANLRQTLARLRKALPDSADGLLQTTPQTIQLKHEAATIDVVCFEELLAECAVHNHTDMTRCPACMARIQHAATLYQGEFLHGLALEHSQPFEEWLLFKREELHRLALDALTTLTQHCEANADYEAMRGYAKRQLALEPWREDAHAQLMRALVSLGDRAGALAQFDACARVLRDELGLTPSAQMTALVERIQAGETIAAPATHPAAKPQPARAYLDEVPETSTVFGREAEAAQLKQWLVADRCKLVSILGMGGQGKTTLAAAVTREVAAQFEVVLWRSLINAPPLDEVLRAMLQSLSEHRINEKSVEIPVSLDEQLALLMAHLRDKRCLLVFDNFESLFHSSEAGAYRAGYEPYGQLIQKLVESRHNSCVLLTSREQPKMLTRLEENATLQRALRLTGLAASAGQAMLVARGLAGEAAQTALLVQRYSGNPLALKLVAQTVQDLFVGDIGSFMAEAAPIFDDIRTVLDQQFARLSALERELLNWLAIEREPTGLPELRANLVRPASPREFMEALRGLQRRSLIEVMTAKVALQNVIMEYVTDLLVDEMCQELQDERAQGLHQHALLKAEAKDYVRQSQARIILQPIAARLGAYVGKAELVKKLRRMLAALHQATGHTPSYAAGNILNLLVHLGENLRGMDFSGMTVWQAWLRGADLQDVNFTGADVSHSVFTDRFANARGLTFSQDGQLFAAGGTDGDIYVWQASLGQLVGVLKGHKQLVLSLNFGRDASGCCPLLASGGEDGTVRLWDVSGLLRTAADPSTDTLGTSAPIASTILYRGEAIVRAISFHAELGLVASSGDDSLIRLWHTAPTSSANTFACAVLRGHTYFVTSLAFSPDGRWLASTSSDHTVRLWDVSRVPTDGTDLITLSNSITILESPEGTGETDTLAYSPDGALIAGITTDRRVWLWQPSMKLPSAPVTFIDESDAHTGALAFSPDGALLAIGNTNGIITLRDIHTRTIVYRGQLHDQTITSLAFSPDGRTLTSAAGPLIKLWDSVAHLPLRTLNGVTLPFSAIAFSTDGTSMVTVAGDWLVRIWDIALEGEGENTVVKRRCRLALPGHTGGMWVCAITRAGNRVASCSEDRTIRLWDCETGRCIHVLRGHEHSVIAVAFSPDGETLASVSLDQTIRLWNVQTGTPLAQLIDSHMLHSIHNGIWSVTFSPNGRILAAGFGDGSILLWDVTSQQLRATLRGHTAWVRSLAFSADGAWLASGSNDHTVCLWDTSEASDASLTSTYPLRHTMREHGEWVMAVAFHPTQPILATAGHDHIIRVWEITDGPTCIAKLEGHRLGVTTVAFHARGDVLVSGGQDEQLMFWDHAQQRCLDALHAPGPYSGMNIAGATGISEAQKAALRALGAVG